MGRQLVLMTEPTVDRDSTKTSAEAAFSAALRDLHVRAGQPSSREMAKGIGAISHSTVYAAVKGTSVPSWPVTEKIVEYLNGDVEAFRDLWVDTRPTAQPRRSYSGPEVSVFVSYARIDDKSSYGRVSKLIDDVADTYQSITGQRVGVFKDVESIQPGDDWRDRIRLGLSASSIFLAFISPAYLRSTNCREELSEFLAFLDSNSSTRLIVPLLFAASDRILNDFGEDELWERIEKLQWLDVSEMRYQDPGSSSWLRAVDRIAERIDEVLKTFMPVGDEPVTADEPGDDTEPIFDRLAEIESTVMPGFNESVVKYSHLMEQLNTAVTAASPEMQRADSFGKKLGVSRKLAQKLSPIADEMETEADRLVSYLGEIGYFGRFVVDAARRDPAEDTPETIQILKSISTMASTGVQSFSAIEGFTRSIDQVLGYSRELDVPLKKIQKAGLRIADLRGIFNGWQEEINTLKDRYPELQL
jgi:hypothetical protein